MMRPLFLPPLLLLAACKSSQPAPDPAASSSSVPISSAPGTPPPQRTRIASIPPASTVSPAGPILGVVVEATPGPEVVVPYGSDGKIFKVKAGQEIAMSVPVLAGDLDWRVGKVDAVLGAPKVTVRPTGFGPTTPSQEYRWHTTPAVAGKHTVALWLGPKDHQKDVTQAYIVTFEVIK